VGLKLGWGYTWVCDLRCAFCYSPRKDRGVWCPRLVERILDANEILDVNWGTGENVLEPSFLEALRIVHRRGVPQSVTSNGALVLRPEALDLIDELDVSIDFPDRRRHDLWRGRAGAWERACRLVREAARRGVRTTVTMVALPANSGYRTGYEMVELARGLGAEMLRINLYFTRRPRSDPFVPEPRRAWELLLGVVDAGARFVGTSDPIVAAVLGVEPVPYAGRSLRILPDGWVTPATYLTWGPWRMANLLSDPRIRDDTGALRTFLGISERVWPREAPERVAVAGRDYYLELATMPRISIRGVLGASQIHVGYLPTTVFAV